MKAHRKNKKKFLWSMPDGRPGLNGAEAPLYRTERLAETPMDVPIDIVEGEECVHALERLGLVSVCGPHGAESKWTPAMTELLKGRHVRVWPDNDEPGRSQADRAATALHGVAASIHKVQLPGLPEKGDVIDFLAMGYDGDEVVRLAEQSCEWQPPAPQELARIVCMADVEPELIEFLWNPYVPRGKLTMIEGDPGVNKSWLSQSVAASVSTGSKFNGFDLKEPGNTLLLVGEDGLGDTVRPRLDAMEANVSNVHVLTGIITEDGDCPLTLNSQGLVALEEAIQRVGPDLVVIDPIVPFLGSRMDMNRANEVRAVLQPLAKLAEQYRCAIVIVRHLNKEGGRNETYRGQGSIDFFAAARSVILVGKDPDDESKRVMVHTKCNYAPKGDSLQFSIEDMVFYWHGTVETSGADLLGSTHEGRSSKVEAAEDFLRTALAGGARVTLEVEEEAKKQGISKRTLDRAKEKLGVESHPVHEAGTKGAKEWLIELPAALRTDESNSANAVGAGELADLNPPVASEILDMPSGHDQAAHAFSGLDEVNELPSWAQDEWDDIA